MLTIDTIETGGARETVGEVSAKAGLANPLEEMLVRRGQLPADQVNHYEADALVDTDAVRTVVPLHVLQALGLAVARQAVAEYADGRRG
jgi:hypothetical protein